MKLTLIRIVCCCFLYGCSVDPVWAQSSVERILKLISDNNPTLRAETQTYQAQRAQLRTGLSLDNPVIEYDYLPGSTQQAGVQQEINLVQPFDFPSVYARRRAVSKLQSEQTTTQERIARQSILLEAKRLCLQVIYHNIHQNDLQNRLNQAVSLATGVRDQLQQGAATALDLSKAELQRIGLENELRMNDQQAQQWLLRLAEMSGGEPVILSDTTYPMLAAIPALPVLDSLIEANDPKVLLARQQVNVAQSQLNLRRAQIGPGFQVGYHYQNLLGVRYQGVHVGVSIPLWQHRHSIAAGQAGLVASESRLNEHRSSHRAHTVRLYEQMQALQQTRNQYRQAFTAADPLPLLNTALRLKQLTVVQYILETTYLYAVTDKFRELERDLQLTVAELMAYQL